MIRVIVVMLFALTACAGSDQYERGVRPPAPPPRAPTFNPTTDAPHTAGQPGYVDPSGRQVRRGKDRRHLPAQERPGIWASDSSEKTATVVARMQPPPEEVPEGITEKAWKQCWADVQACMLADPRMVRAGPNDFMCLHEQLVRACGMLRVDRGAMGDRYTLGKYGPGYYDVGDFGAAANARTWGACQGLDSSKEAVNELYQWLYPRCHPAWSQEGRR